MTTAGNRAGDHQSPRKERKKIRISCNNFRVFTGFQSGSGADGEGWGGGEWAGGGLSGAFSGLLSLPHERDAALAAAPPSCAPAFA